MTISDPFRCIAECTKIGSSCNALIFDRWKKTRGTNVSMRQMPIFREAGQCHLGWASPPCNKSEPTTSVFLARRISEFPCFSELFSTFSIKSLPSNDFERKLCIAFWWGLKPDAWKSFSNLFLGTTISCLGKSSVNYQNVFEGRVNCCSC